MRRDAGFIAGWRAAILETSPRDEWHASRQFDALVDARLDTAPSARADARAVELIFSFIAEAPYVALQC